MCCARKYSREFYQFECGKNICIRQFCIRIERAFRIDIIAKFNPLCVCIIQLANVIFFTLLHYYLCLVELLELRKRGAHVRCEQALLAGHFVSLCFCCLKKFKIKHFQHIKLLPSTPVYALVRLHNKICVSNKSQLRLYLFYD